jgi:hypothetical protein
MFHRVAGHLPPTFLAREKITSSIGWQDTHGRMISAEYYDSMFAILTPDDWHSSYYPKSFRPLDDIKRENRAMIALHVYTAIGAECELIRDAIGYLGGSKDFVEQRTRTALVKFNEFFHRNNPIRAIDAYLSDKNDEGDYKWTKPLLPESRNDLESVLDSVHMEKMSANWRARMIRILRHQKAELEVCQEEWQPTFSQYIPDIARHGYNHGLEVQEKRMRRFRQH